MNNMENENVLRIIKDGILSNKKIKECPFCGSDAKISEDGDRDMNATIPFYFVECKKCKSRGESFSTYYFNEYTCKSKAIDSWNRRV